MLNGARWVGFQRTALGDAPPSRASATIAAPADWHLERAQTRWRRSATAQSTHPAPFGPRYAMLPPAPPPPLAIRQSDLLPYYFKVSTDARETIVAATEVENPQRLLAGRFDLAFVIVFLYPLLILAVPSNMLSIEKEQGTLALAAAQPVSLGTLTAGKVLARALLLVGLVVGLSLLALSVTGVSLTSPGAAPRLGLWLVAVAAYGAFWFTVAALVASFGRSSSANATMLATAWMALVVLLPSLFNLIATTVHAVPSRVEMIQAVRVASDDASSAGSTLLARYYEDHPELAAGGAEQAMTDFNIVRVAVDDDVSRRVRPVVERYEQQLVRQQRLIDRLRFLSPAIVMQDALNDVAGTGSARHRHFLAQVDRYHAGWRGFVVPLIFQKQKITALDDVPSFSYQEERTRGLVRRVSIDLAGLLVPATAIAWRVRTPSDRVSVTAARAPGGYLCDRPPWDSSSGVRALRSVSLIAGSSWRATPARCAAFAELVGGDRSR